VREALDGELVKRLTRLLQVRRAVEPGAEVLQVLLDVAERKRCSLSRVSLEREPVLAEARARPAILGALAGLLETLAGVVS
jgi:hypothetical protein